MKSNAAEDDCEMVGGTGDDRRSILSSPRKGGRSPERRVTFGPITEFRDVPEPAVPSTDKVLASKESSPEVPAEHQPQNTSSIFGHSSMFASPTSNVLESGGGPLAAEFADETMAATESAESQIQSTSPSLFGGLTRSATPGFGTAGIISPLLRPQMSSPSFFGFPGSSADTGSIFGSGSTPLFPSSSAGLWAAPAATSAESPALDPETGVSAMDQIELAAGSANEPWYSVDSGIPNPHSGDNPASYSGTAGTIDPSTVPPQPNSPFQWPKPAAQLTNSDSFIGRQTPAVFHSNIASRSSRLLRSQTPTVCSPAKMRDLYITMPLEQKRSLYMCGGNFRTLASIRPWGQYAVEEKLFDHRPSLAEVYGYSHSTVCTVDHDINNKVSLFVGDITTLEIDCIVNAANTKLINGAGVCGAIFGAAGLQLDLECNSLGYCDIGDAKVTAGYYLPARYVVHTVGPLGERPLQLADCYNNCLKQLLSLYARSMAFPCISTGIYGFPSSKAVHVALGVTRRWLEFQKSMNNLDVVDRLIFCVFRDEDVKLYESWMQIYFPVQSHSESASTSASTDSITATRSGISGTNRAASTDGTAAATSGISCANFTCASAPASANTSKWNGISTGNRVIPRFVSIIASMIPSGLFSSSNANNSAANLPVEEPEPDEDEVDMENANPDEIPHADARLGNHEDQEEGGQ